MSLEYGGTEGSSGSDASWERAEREAMDGTAAARQADVLAYLNDRGTLGATWGDLADDLHLHHGQATGALSNLHKGGRVARLTEKRGRSSVYVLPEHVDGRETAAHGRRAMPTEYPHRRGAWLILGPDVMASLDGERIIWQGRKYHPLDSHDPEPASPRRNEPEALF